VTERLPRYTVHDGFRMPMGFPIAGFESGQRYRASSGDVFVTTYPKCGTTWTQYIVYLLLNDGEPLSAGRKIEHVFPHLEEVGADALAELAEPRLIKTHLPLERTPWSDAARYIYVARNPFDCAVSFFHHTRGFVKHYDFADGTWDAFFECFLRGEVDFGDYFDNLLSWWPKRAAGNVLWLTYEDMLAEPATAARTIGRFLGGTAAIAASDAATLDRVLAQSSFASMSRDQTRWASARPADMPGFVRKGVVGDWRNHFSRQQAHRLAAKLRRRTEGTGADAQWPGLLATVDAWVNEEEA
jgi:hypothetical protein